MNEKELSVTIARFIQNSIFFDDKWYRKKYHIPDNTWAAGHYFTEGWKYGFDPSEYFSTREYLERNRDVLMAGINPLFHYECYGKHENDRYPLLQDNMDRILGQDMLCKHRIEGGLLRLRITNRCNGRCRYCGLRGWSQEEQRQEMDPKWYYEYCKPLYEKLNIVLITGGDAYVARESYNYMAFLSKNYPKVTIATESNGIAFSKKFRELACENLFKTHFSINASNVQTFIKGCWEGPNGNVAYNKSLENIRAYVELLKERNRLCLAPSLSMVINKDTAHDVVDFARLALSLHAFSVNYYFDYTENDMDSPSFGNPETSRPALKRLMEIERVLAGKIHVYFRLWIPHEEAGRLQTEVEATPIKELHKRYKDLLELTKNRSVTEEFKERDKLRTEMGKRLLTLEEDYSPTIRMTDIGQKSVCFAAWSELDLYPNGRLDFCGWFRPTLNFKDYIRNDSVNWDAILNSNEYRIFRRNILNDNYQGCMSCCPMNSCTTEIDPPFKYGLDRLMYEQDKEIKLPKFPSEKEILKNWKGDVSKPLVSISCITYNHEKYIRDCLDGFLQQKTAFPIEILIHDDASTDNTAEIIKSYAERYPTIIKPIIQKENQFSRGVLITIEYIYPRAKGKYLAVCEGDDYWTDPLKLQKQVDFMEAHPECSMCFHPVVVKHEDNTVHDHVFPHPQTHPFVFEGPFTELKHLIPFNYIQTNSVIYRWRFYNENIEDIFPKDILPGDWFLHLLHAEKGKIGFINDVMAVYRRHSGGIWWEAGRNQEKFYLQNGMKHLACYKAIEERWPELVSPYSKEITANFASDVIKVFLKTQNLDELVQLKQQFSEYYDRGVTYLLSQYENLANVIQSEKRKNEYLAKENGELKARMERHIPKSYPKIAASGENKFVDTSFDVEKGFQRPLVSIIIPLFNKVEFTKKCLNAMFQNTPDELYELIVIDNASMDETKTFLKTLSKGNTRVITNEKNLGFAKANNQGADCARGVYLLFLNNDTEPGKGWLEALLDIAERDPSVAAVGSKLLYPDRTIQHGGVIIVDDRINNDPLQARNNHVNKPADAPDANKATLYQALTAGCVLIRKAAFAEAGGFDEGYWNGYEDVDLCFKLQVQGGKLVYQPASIVIHHESKSGPERFARVRENIERLHSKWIGKIKPDMILNQDGSIALTDTKKILPYIVPKILEKQPMSTEYPVCQGLISIIILTYNQLDQTKLCLQSIEQHTAEPYEIIIVDNASTDETPNFLRNYQSEHPNILVIYNKNNRGFAGGNNQGLAIAKGEFVLLLNNDTVVTDGWLTRMMKIFKNHPEVGIVGPMSNYVSGPQLISNVQYKNMKQMHRFAKQLSVKYSGQTADAFRIVGFCMMARSAVVDKIGGLDERFGRGNFEDDDFCVRAAIAGFKSKIAKDVFIHHTGGQTFRELNINYEQSIEKNWNIFKTKWNIPAATPYGSYSISLNLGDHSKYYIPLPIAITQANADEYQNANEKIIKTDANSYGKELKCSENKITEDLYREAISRQEAGQTNLAIEKLEMVLEIDRYNAEAYNDVGVLYFQQGDAEKAAGCLHRAIELDPDNLDYKKNIADVYLQTEKVDIAVEFYADILSMNPNDVEVLFALARLCSQAGLEKDAQIYLDRISAIEPDNEYVKQLSK